MAKAKNTKQSKPRPDKYADKVAINVGFDEVLRIFSDAAHDNNAVKIEEPDQPQAEEC